MPPWVIPTQWPREPSASLSHPSTRSTRRWGAPVQACGAAAPARRTGRGPRSQRGASRGNLGGLCALPPMEAGGPPEQGRRTIPPAKGLVERRAQHCQALGDVLQGRQPTPRVRARVRPVEEASHEDVLQVEEAGERPLEGVEHASDGREGPLRARVVGRQCAAHMGEPEAEGRRQVAPRHPTARLLLPGPQAAAGNRLLPATAHLVRGLRQVGAVRGVRDVAARHSASCNSLCGA